MSMLEAADCLFPELPLRSLFDLLLWGGIDLVAQKAAMQRGTRQMWYHILKRMKTIIEWQQSVAPKRHARRLLRGRENRRARILRTHRKILNKITIAPLLHSALAYPELARKVSHALPAVLNLEAGDPRCCGTAVQYLDRESSWKIR